MACHLEDDLVMPLHITQYKRFAFTPGIALILLLIVLFLVAGCFRKTDQRVNWENGFEDVENFRKATPEGLREAVEDCILHGDCWIEEENWLEVGPTDTARNYELAPDMADASVTPEIAHITIPPIKDIEPLISMLGWLASMIEEVKKYILTISMQGKLNK